MRKEEVIGAIANEGLTDEDVAILYKGKDGKMYIINDKPNFINGLSYNRQTETKAFEKMFKDFKHMTLSGNKVHLNEEEAYILNFMREDRGGLLKGIRTYRSRTIGK